MRLALVEDQTALCRTASKSEPLFSPPPSLGTRKQKASPRVSHERDLFFAEEAYGSFIVQALSLTAGVTGCQFRCASLATGLDKVLLLAALCLVVQAIPFPIKHLFD